MCQIMDEIRAEGREEGIITGKAEGIAETSKKTAISLIRMGILTVMQIAEATCLSVEEVLRLKNNRS